MKELVDNPNTVVFIDELHTLVGAGSAEGSLDAANILKPALSRGEIQCIGATTPAEYRKSIEKDRSLERRFQAVKVGAPSENEAVRILQGVKSRYEKFHMVNYTDEAIESAVYLSNRYIPDRFLPDKAIDLLDEAGARVKLRQATLPSEMTDIQRRIKFIVARMESAISSKDFEKAEHYKNQEQLERENLRNVREKFNISETTSMGVVTKADIELLPNIAQVLTLELLLVLVMLGLFEVLARDRAFHPRDDELDPPLDVGHFRRQRCLAKLDTRAGFIEKVDGFVG